MHGRRQYGESSFLPIWLYAIAIVGIIVITQVIAHNISEESAVRAAEGFGYTNVQVTDRHTFFVNFQGCAKEDLVMFDVTATDANNVERSFVVCDGLFKGATVRFK